MSADGSIEIFFGDGMHPFRFAIGEFRELQEKVNLRRVAIGAPLIGPNALRKQLQANDIWPDDLRDILRIGLNGGGMKPADTHRLLVNHFDGKPKLQFVPVAHAALLTGLVGPIGDDIDSKKKTEETEKPPTTTAPSGSPASTATAQP